MDNMTVFTAAGIDYLFRWGHLLAGMTWVGLLYYFNFVQAEYFKEAEPAHRAGVVLKLLPRALWWFRWGAMVTFLTGVLLLAGRHSAITADIAVGATLGTLMFLNVWLVIWPSEDCDCLGKPGCPRRRGVARGGSRGAQGRLGLSDEHTVFSAHVVFYGLLGAYPQRHGQRAGNYDPVAGGVGADLRP